MRLSSADFENQNVHDLVQDLVFVIAWLACRLKGSERLKCLTMGWWYKAFGLVVGLVLVWLSLFVQLLMFCGEVHIESSGTSGTSVCGFVNRVDIRLVDKPLLKDSLSC